jgi:hypothetical protein
LLTERLAADTDLSEFDSRTGEHLAQARHGRFDGAPNIGTGRDKVSLAPSLSRFRVISIDPSCGWMEGQLGELLFIAGKPQQLLTQLAGPGRIM